LAHSKKCHGLGEKPLPVRFPGAGSDLLSLVRSIVDVQHPRKDPVVATHNDGDAVGQLRIQSEWGRRKALAQDDRRDCSVRDGGQKRRSLLECRRCLANIMAAGPKRRPSCGIRAINAYLLGEPLLGGFWNAIRPEAFRYVRDVDQVTDQRMIGIARVLRPALGP
jgi:hypothetical protein